MKFLNSLDAAPPLPVASGGTNSTATPTSGGVGYGTGTAHAYTAAGTATQALVSNGAAAPTWATLDLTYLPTAWVKKSVRVATTANITLSGTQTIDTIAVVAGDRVLVKNQTTASQNGIYTVAAGAWTRATDSDVTGDIAGGAVNIDGGSQGGQLWSTSFKNTDTLGTTSMLWAQVLDTSSGVALTGIQTVTGSKFWSGTQAFGDLSGTAAGLARINTIGPASAGSPYLNSGVVQFRTSYWTGAANVYEDFNLYVVRRSATAGDVYLSFLKDIITPFSMDAGDHTVGSRSIGRGFPSGGYAEITVNSTTNAATTTLADVTGLSVTITAATARRYKITFMGQMFSSVAADQGSLAIREGATTLMVVNGPSMPIAARGYALTSSVTVTPTAGSHTYKISISRVSGTGNVNLIGAAGSASFILVEDIGQST